MAQGTQPNTERNEKVCEDYKNGMDVPLIAVKYDITPSYMYVILKRAGIPLRRKPRKKNEKLLIVDFNFGMPLASLMEKYEVTEKELHKIFKKNGITMAESEKNQL